MRRRRKWSAVHPQTKVTEHLKASYVYLKERRNEPDLVVNVSGDRSFQAAMWIPILTRIIKEYKNILTGE